MWWAFFPESLLVEMCVHFFVIYLSFSLHFFRFQLADRVAEKATSAFAPSSGAQDAFSGGGAAAAVQGSMDIDGVTKALDWWEKKAAAVDEECRRLSTEGKRCAEELTSQGASFV